MRLPSWQVERTVPKALGEALPQTFTKLRGVALDTRHLAMKYESVASHQICRFVYVTSPLDKIQGPSENRCHSPAVHQYGTHIQDAEETLYFHDLQTSSLPRRDIELALVSHLAIDPACRGIFKNPRCTQVATKKKRGFNSKGGWKLEPNPTRHVKNVRLPSWQQHATQSVSVLWPTTPCMQVCATRRCTSHPTTQREGAKRRDT